MKTAAAANTSERIVAIQAALLLYLEQKPSWSAAEPTNHWSMAGRRELLGEPPVCALDDLRR